MKKIALLVGALILAVWAVVFLGVLPHQLSKAQSIPFTASPADVGLDYEEISVPVVDEGLSLSAWWMPAKNARSVILFVHGGNSNKEEFYFSGLDYYAELVARGHHVLAIDLRNHGKSDRTESGRLAFGREEHRDVSAALTLIESLAPGLPIIGSGVSMGGATLIEAAARDSRLEALVLIDPLLDTKSSTLSAVVAIVGLPRPLLVPTLWSSKLFFGARLSGAEPLETGTTLTLPILLLQDPDDPVTHAEFAATLATANAHVTYHLLPAVSPDDPGIADSGGWGTHASAFRLHRKETLTQITRFLSNL